MLNEAAVKQPESGLRCAQGLKKGKGTLTEPQRAAPRHLQIDQVEGLVIAAGTDGALAILDAFQRSTTDLLKSIEADLAQDALGEASRIAHAIKGSAANVGAEALAEAASGIEVACKGGDSETARARLEDVKVYYVAFCDAFRAHIEQF